MVTATLTRRLFRGHKDLRSQMVACFTTTTNASPEVVIVKNNAVLYPSSSKLSLHAIPNSTPEFLKLFPRGAYTSARTVSQQRKIFQYDFHCNRLINSTANLFKQRNNVGIIINHEDITQNVKTAIECFRNSYAECSSELKVTLLSTISNDDDDSTSNAAAAIYCFISPLKTVDEGSSIRVKVCNENKKSSGRNNATTKDSGWITKKQDLWNSTAGNDDIHELLLTNGSLILEGTETNFFLITVDGTVKTADTGVLKGTVRDVVLHVCKEEGIPVSLSPPTIEEVGTASGAFLTSTSRMVLPIDEVIMSDSSTSIQFSRSSSVLNDIQALVQKDIDRTSVSII